MDGFLSTTGSAMSRYYFRRGLARRQALCADTLGADDAKPDGQLIR
jgi:hypothetical protein